MAAMQNLWSWSVWTKGRLPVQLQRWGREQYISLKPSELIAKLMTHHRDTTMSHDLVDATLQEFEEDFRTVCSRICTLVHNRYRDNHLNLIRLYEDFDPDADNLDLKIAQLSELELKAREENCRSLFSEISDTLHHANYRRLTPIEIQDAFTAASHWGVQLKIRFSSFRRLEVYGRGDVIAKRQRRNWKKWFRMEEIDVQIYQRIVVMFRTKELQNLPELLDPNCVHVRMFKNVPKADVDMMLPGSQVKLSWKDTSKIGIPTVWGLASMAIKLAKIIPVFAALSAIKMFSTAVFIIAIVVASLVYAVKSALSYSTTKRRYQLNVARSLYYQNLDNNLGALLRLLDESEQQEICEVILGYYVLLNSNKPVMTAEAMDQEAERLLRLFIANDVDFDIEDAIRDLAESGIIQAEPEGWYALSLDDALHRLASN